LSASGVPVAAIPGDGSEVDVNIVSRAGDALRNGEVVAIPTDTVYGLAAAIDRPDAIDQLYVLKGRPAEKAIPILISDIARLDKLTPHLSSTAALLAEIFWPGALTLVLPARPDLPRGVTVASGRIETVAVRMPDHDLARSIIAAAEGALAVTSANRSGAPPAVEVDEVRRLRLSQPLLIVDGGRTPGGVPSTIVNVTTELPEILREGVIPASAIAAVIAGVEPTTGNEALARYDQRMMQHRHNAPPDATP
jgi:L-threonylcarbamoyladenylate synthase